MRNQRGASSVLLLLIPLGAAILIYGSNYVSWITNHQKLQAQDRVNDDSNSLKVSLKMLLSNSTICQQSLNSGGFGTSDSHLSVKRPLRLYFPQVETTSANAASKNYLGIDSFYQNILITGITLDPGSLVANTLEKSYLIDMIVNYKSPSSTIERTLKMPMYFVSNSSSQLVDCKATAYAVTSETTEEFLCHQVKGYDYTYLPGQRSCVPKNSPLAQN